MRRRAEPALAGALGSQIAVREGQRASIVVERDGTSRISGCVSVCGITLELTGAHEACARSARMHLCVRVERPVM